MQEKTSDKYMALQALWTKQTRNYLYRRANLAHAKHILDVGCGTGVLTAEIAERTCGTITGIDNNPAVIEKALSRFPTIDFKVADAEKLLFKNESFDIVLCHFFLMWVDKLSRVLQEIFRVTKKNGYIIACAEPDYYELIEEPPDCVMKNFLIESLLFEGADPSTGGKLKEIFSEAGLDCEVGSLTKQQESEELLASFDIRWNVYSRIAEKRGVDISELKEKEFIALKAGTRSFTLPVFWAFTKKI
ncbi:MAG: class I SAM-dependent methyltransferase [Planctomycetota bacterium]